MKKLLAAVGLLGLMFGVSQMGRAGVALDQGAQPASYHTAIFASSATAANVNISLVAPSVSSGGQTCQNCFTKWVVQEGTYTILNVLDGGTTVYVIDGAGLGASGINTHISSEEHLGPFCMTAGNATTFNAVTTNGSNNHTVINYEGYTFCGPSRN